MYTTIVLYRSQSTLIKNLSPIKMDQCGGESNFLRQGQEQDPKPQPRYTGTLQPYLAWNRNADMQYSLREMSRTDSDIDEFLQDEECVHFEVLRTFDQLDPANSSS